MCGTRHTFANAQIKYFAGVAEYNGTQVQSEPAKVYAEWFPDRSWGIAHGYGTKHIPIANAVRLGLRLLVTKESNPRPIDRIVEFRKTANPTVCNAKCRSARGPMCDCSCGGRNHGISVVMSRTRFAASDLDFKPTAEMAANAARGLELREKHGKGGTAVGVARARDIKNRANLSPDTVKRMHSFFSRHEGNQAGGEDDAGYIAWLLWGGDAGKAWAARKAAQIDKSESARGAARKATMARDRDVKVRKGNFTDTVAIVGQNGNESADWYAGLILRHKDGEEQVLWMKHNYKTEAAATKYAIQKFDAHVGRGGYSRPGAKAAFAANSVDLWNFLSRNDTRLTRQNKNDLALHKKYAKMALSLPDFTPPSHAQHGPSLHTMAKDVLAEIKAWEEQVYRYRNRAPWEASRPGAKAAFADKSVLAYGYRLFVDRQLVQQTHNSKTEQDADNAAREALRYRFNVAKVQTPISVEVLVYTQMGIKVLREYEKHIVNGSAFLNFSRPGKSAFSLAAVKSAAAKVAAAYGTGEDSAVIRKHLDRIVSVLSGNSEGGRREAMGIHAQIGSVAERTHGRDFMWSAPMQGLESAIRSAGQFARPGAKARFDRMAVANEILRQLGGGRFMAMVGGKNALATTVNGKNGLQVQIGRGAKNGINRLVVLLDEGSDTYDMQLWRIGQRGLSTTKVWEGDGLYAEDLARIFTDKTGFYTSFARPGAKAKFYTSPTKTGKNGPVTWDNLFVGHLGNGWTLANKGHEVSGDYERVAHIAYGGEVTFAPGFNQARLDPRVKAYIQKLSVEAAQKKSAGEPLARTGSGQGLYSRPGAKARFVHPSWSTGLLGKETAPQLAAYSWIDNHLGINGNRTQMLLADIAAEVHAQNPSLSIQQAILKAAQEMVQKGVATYDIRALVENRGWMSRPGAKARFGIMSEIQDAIDAGDAIEARTLLRKYGSGLSKANREDFEEQIARMSRPGKKSTHATDNMYYTVAAHIGDQPAGERTTKSLDEAKAHAKAMLAALKPNAKGKPLVVDVYPVVNYSPQAPVLSLKASRTSADSNRLTLAQRIAVAHDAKRMALR